MLHKQEWKVLLNGILFTDRINSKEEAKEEISKGVFEQYGNYDEFTFEKMNNKDLQVYFANDTYEILT